MLEELGRVFGAQLSPSDRERFAVRVVDDAYPLRLGDADHPFSAVVCNSVVEPATADVLARRIGAPPEQVVLGQRRLVVVVNRENALARMTVSQFQTLLAGRDRPDPIAVDAGVESFVPEVEPAESWSRQWLTHSLLVRTITDGGVTTQKTISLRADIWPGHDPEEIIKRVQKNVRAVGVFQFAGQDLSKVRIVEVAAGGGKPSTKLDVRSLIQADYLLSESVVFIARPDATDVLKRFGKFLLTEDGATILAKHGVSTLHAQRVLEGSERLEMARQRHGPTLKGGGSGDTRELFNGLASEYVRERAIVRPLYVVGENAAVKEFYRGLELLISSGKIESQLGGREDRGRWDSLNNSPDSLAKVGEVFFAARALAVVVNKQNRLESITVDQLLAAYEGEADNWHVLGGAERTAGVAPVRFLMPGRKDAVTELFIRMFKIRDKATTNHRAGSTEVLAEVSADRGAIGVVSFASLPVDFSKSGLKVLTLTDGKASHNPTAASIVDGTYPYAERFYLYVHPKASKEAQDFAAMLAEPGRWANTFAEHGFVRTMPAPEKVAEPADADAKPKPRSSRKKAAPATTQPNGAEAKKK